MTKPMMQPLQASAIPQRDEIDRTYLMELQGSDMTKPLESITGGNVKFIEAQAAGDEDGDGKTLPKYEMDLYTGGVIFVAWYGRVIIDLEGGGVVIQDKDIPTLLDHYAFQAMGHGRSRQVGNKIINAGVFSGTGKHVPEVLENMANGMPYQASIGIQPLEGGWERLGENETATVNGQEVEGPILILRKGIHHEATITLFGADSNTSTRLAAMAQKKESNMPFSEWLKAKGFVEADLSKAQLESLKAMFEEEKKALEAGAVKPGEEPESKPAPVGAADAGGEIREALKAERQRLAEIEAACQGDWTPEQQKQVNEIRAAAIAGEEDGGTVAAKVLNVIRASRTSVPNVTAGESNLNAKSLEAALCIQGGMDAEKVQKKLGEKAVAASADMQQMGLQDFMRLAARSAGASLPMIVGDGTAFLQASLSILGITDILESAANKILLEGFSMNETYYQDVAEIASVNNFQSHSRYRLSGTGAFQDVGHDGELKHGDLADDKFTIQADTKGSHLGISRKDVVNDDLGAFLQLPRMMGEEAAWTIDDALFTLVLANTDDFFGSTNGNLGTSSALADATLSTQRGKYRLQKRKKTDKDDKAKTIGLAPNILMVPPELEHTADVLVTSETIQSGSSARGSKNPHRNKYKVVSPTMLSDSAYTGYSATAWYLLNNRHKPWVVSFLKGKQAPTIMTGTDPRPNYLGIYVSGYIDFGVNQADYRTGRKVTA